jgi:hypothetical protein
MCFQSSCVRTYILQYSSQISTSIQLVPEACSSWIKPRVKFDNSPLPFAEFKNKWSFSSTICFYGLCGLKYFVFSLIKIFSAVSVSHPRQVSSLYVFIEVCLKVQFRRYISLRHPVIAYRHFERTQCPPSFSF